MKDITFEFRSYEVGKRRVVTAEVRSRGALVGRGAAICMPSDTYSTTTGRRKAVARAVAGYSRPIRIEVFNAFEERSPVTTNRNALRPPIVEHNGRNFKVYSDLQKDEVAKVPGVSEVFFSSGSCTHFALDPRYTIEEVTANIAEAQAKHVSIPF